MRVIIQRVAEASVSINEEKTARIGKGLLVFLGITEGDGQEDIEWLCRKIVQLRIFSDNNGLMNHSLADIEGELLVVSQFTLFASTKKGNRPSYIRSAKPSVAIPLYESFLNQAAKELGKAVQSGRFGADMKVALINDGPVTISIDSKNKE